ncbi:hypothetical protein PC129_g13586 [Phytophthora cactorum]|uniref:BZIP domain-containing protein n=3 Tax=Phytophthora cactorum TaxID=29920 RepID=A0A329S8D4_9STRA|nr:hypothetical protein PC111_g14219 [Phytophthora cactorum]KAG2846540.1 hypothetical protein PC112_g1394 [Phytophthora cactorum]KAG2898175.1 hypothetical protein PC114_g14381 [Phytophthora cactorum]KAG2954372.1 hypothetical protein PC117_g1219 [Phytophthora cactorum]KAG2987080.1 hypothetical protein PC118_g7483 [Phytophthora cactorum]
MANYCEAPGIRSHHFEQARAKLSDNLVGQVLPRSQATSRRSNHVTTRDSSAETTSALLSLTEEWSQDPRKRSLYEHLTVHSSTLAMNRRSGLPASPSRAESMSSSTDQEKVGFKRNRIKSEIRREQCRANQARYRNKQRNLQIQLESSVEKLRQKLARLKRRRQDIVLAEKTDQNPWIIVAEVFHVLQNSFRCPWNLEIDEDMQNDNTMRKNLAFLQKTFTSDVAMGELSGIDELINQWRRYSQYFGDARLHLQRVESMAPGVMKATARLHVTITELIVRFAFPHLSEPEPVSKYDINPPLRERLKGKHLDCSVSIDFQFDEDNGRVTRLEPRIDVIPALLRKLGDLSDVVEVCYSLSDDAREGF